MKKFLTGFILGVGLVSATEAADLKIGLSSFTTSMDPQFYVGGNNSAMVRNIFDALINQDELQRLQPALAVSWAALDDTTWEFKLRDGVVFHDGNPLTAQDVVASIRRVPQASQNSPSSFMAYVQDISDIEAADALTVRIKTSKPTPLLPNNLSRIAILPAHTGELSTADMNAGRGVIGTGPFRFVSWTPDEVVVLARHDAYWDKPAQWENITFRSLKNSSTRVAALLAGDVDMIENVPSTDIASLTKNASLKVITTPSNRVMYLHMDQDRDTSPFAIGPDGRNPLMNADVRRAISLAINRQAIVDRIMEGQGKIAGQLVPDGYFGFSPAIQLDEFDLKKARELLAGAGYQKGFKMTFHSTNDRYPNDSKVAQAVGQMLSRAGIEMEVSPLPGSVFFPRASAREFSLIMGGAAVETGEASGVLGPLLATFSKEAGQGNRGRYSSPDFDTALNTALATIDDGKREKLLQTAMEISMKDLGVIPLFFLAHTWAVKSDLQYQPRADGYTLGYYVTRSGN